MIQINKITRKQFVDEDLICTYPLRIFILEKGFGLVKIDGQELDFLAGRVYFIPKDVSLQIKGFVSAAYLISIDQLLYQTFIFQSHFNPQIHLFNNTNNIFDLAWGSLEKISPTMKKLENELESGADFEHLNQLFSLLLIDSNPYPYYSLANEQLSFKEAIMQKLEYLIEDNFKRHRTGDFYAKEMGLSSKDLNLICKKMTGKLVVDLIMERLMFEAEYLLLNTQKPVKSIANTLGFFESWDFAIYFEKLRGKTPFAYRSK
jgi:AraC-like DNA-binding protein